MSRRHVLAADVGGTRTMVALAVVTDGKPEIVTQHSYSSRDFTGFEALLADFLGRPSLRQHTKIIEAACFAVAGPVAQGSATLTNLGWLISTKALRERFSLPVVRLINDFAAAGLGITRLVPHELETLQAGEPCAGGAQAVIGAGTGLGVALLTWDGERYAVHPSEAGHADFAPVDAIQDRLLAWLRRASGHVSYEAVVSGSGLERIFDFLQHDRAVRPEEALREALATCEDAAAVIAGFALSRRDSLAVQALDLFIAIYGAFAGNVALAALARDGVYVAGGIAPRIITRLKQGGFVRAFTDKGRFSNLLSRMPLHVVMNPQVGLYGALGEASCL